MSIDLKVWSDLRGLNCWEGFTVILLPCSLFICVLHIQWVMVSLFLCVLFNLIYGTSFFYTPLSPCFDYVHEGNWSPSNASAFIAKRLILCGGFVAKKVPSISSFLLPPVFCLLRSGNWIEWWVFRRIFH